MPCVECDRAYHECVKPINGTDCDRCRQLELRCRFVEPPQGPSRRRAPAESGVERSLHVAPAASPRASSRFERSSAYAPQSSLLSRSPLVPPQAPRQRPHSFRSPSALQGADHHVYGRPYPSVPSVLVQPSQVASTESMNQMQYTQQNPMPFLGRPSAPYATHPRGPGHVYSQSYPPASGFVLPSASTTFPYQQLNQQSSDTTRIPARASSGISAANSLPMAPRPPPPPPALHLRELPTHSPLSAFASAPDQSERLAMLSAEYAAAQPLADILCERYRTGHQDGMAAARGNAAQPVLMYVTAAVRSNRRDAPQLPPEPLVPLRGAASATCQSPSLAAMPLQQSAIPDAQASVSRLLANGYVDWYKVGYQDGLHDAKWLGVVDFQTSQSISGPSNARTSPQNRYTTSQPLTHIPPSASGLTGLRPTSTAAGRVRVFGYEASQQMHDRPRDTLESLGLSGGPVQPLSREEEEFLQQMQGEATDLHAHRMEFVGGFFQGRDMLPDQDMDDFGHSRSGADSARGSLYEPCSPLECSTDESWSLVDYASSTASLASEAEDGGEDVMTRYGRRETHVDEGGEVISDDDVERDAPATIVDGVQRLQLDSSFEVQRAMNGGR